MDELIKVALSKLDESERHLIEMVQEHHRNLNVCENRLANALGDIEAYKSLIKEIKANIDNPEMVSRLIKDFE